MSSVISPRNDYYIYLVPNCTDPSFIFIVKVFPNFNCKIECFSSGPPKNESATYQNLRSILFSYNHNLWKLVDSLRSSRRTVNGIYLSIALMLQLKKKIITSTWANTACRHLYILALFTYLRVTKTKSYN